MPHRAKKSLGQHFLRSTSAVKAIVAAGELTPSDTVLEIGPGEGILTQALLATGARVIAIEKDRDLIPLLSEKFAAEIAAGKFELIQGDVLEFDAGRHKLKTGGYKLIANIPYYITGAIIEQFLTEEHPPERMVLLIQKEVATRIVARDQKESILSLSVKAFGIPKIMAKVPASAFRPAPKVDSAVLAITAISHKHFPGAHPTASIKHFFDIVHAGFAHKRKLAIRNLEAASKKAAIEAAFEKLGIPAKARAEDLPLALWLALAELLPA